MFEAVELGRKITKTQLKVDEAELRQSLLTAQFNIKAKQVPVIIIVSGMINAGKGEVVNLLYKWFDPRDVETHAFWDETDEEQERPAFWRFWRRLPPRGRICILFGGWYLQPLNQHALGRIEATSLDEHARRIEELERMLTEDGALVIKLWLHLSQRIHDKRHKARQQKGGKRSIATTERKLAKRYNTFVETAERLLRMTDTGICPWYLIEANDPNYRDIQSGRTILQALVNRIQNLPSNEHRTTHTTSSSEPDGHLNGTSALTILDHIDLSATLATKTYQKKLATYQDRLDSLIWHAYDQKRSSIVVFEGWDAAGKGGAIRRITCAIDARLYRTISISAPTDEELAHHYLWRFWRHIPRAGYLTLYDRSWYGRVLVERIEGIAQSQEWMRAYQEINDFEEQLSDHGIIISKFWIHISNQEQLRRFEQRQNIPWKQHKITDEDWRNREKWDHYKLAVNEMIARTSTASAPWHVIAGEHKNFARIQILKTLTDRLAKMLKK